MTKMISPKDLISEILDLTKGKIRKIADACLDIALPERARVIERLSLIIGSIAEYDA